MVKSAPMRRSGPLRHQHEGRADEHRDAEQGVRVADAQNRRGDEPTGQQRPRRRSAEHGPRFATRRAVGSVAGHPQPACYSPRHAALSLAQRPLPRRASSVCCSAST